MDTPIEIMIWLGLGIVLLALIGVFAYNWDVRKDAESLLSSYSDEETQEFRTDELGFAKAVVDALANCSNRSVHVMDTGLYSNSTLSMERLFGTYKELGWCKSVQSASQGCGTKENVNMTNITLPAVIKMTCINRTMYLR